ncbi:MAG: hypothetical protein COA74_03990 [Gammaproteobacteria bacterium]|nr:MAG: hypothetical protein COA74_03990 [Gammaproteobacteria bacterium]
MDKKIDINYFGTFLTEDLLPQIEGKVYLFGAGEVSQAFAKKLERITDTPISGFLTTYPSYKINIGRVNNYKDHWTAINQPNITIIVINQFAREIINLLRLMNIKARIINAIHLIFPFAHLLSQNNETAILKRADAIEIALTSHRSKHLYRELIRCRTSKVIKQSIQETYENFYLLMNEYYGLGDNYCSQHYFEHHELEKLQTIVEGGVCFGDISRKLLPLLSSKGQLHAFEPGFNEIITQTNDKPLHRIIKNPKYQNQFKINVQALWHKTESLFFSNDRNFTRRHISNSGTKIDAISLDEYSKKVNLNSLDLIKLDIEGAEPNFIEGAICTIKRFRPSLSISIYHNNDQIVKIPEMLIKELEDYRFEIGHHSNSPWLETVLYAVPEKS